MKLTVIHPSRGRAEIAKQVQNKWLSSAINPDNIEYILSIDTSDETRADYMARFESNVIVEEDNHTAIEAINNAAKYATGDLLIVVSDDFDCPQGWDEKLLSYLKGKKDFVVKTDDTLQPWLITLPIMDRDYYNRFGYIYNPDYKHMFCDTEMTCVGDLLDKTIIVPMTFKHRHYTQSGGIKKDHISQRNDATWAQGEALYLKRIQDNFGIKNPKGVLRCDNNHISWLQSKGVKFEMV